MQAGNGRTSEKQPKYTNWSRSARTNNRIRFSSTRADQFLFLIPPFFRFLFLSPSLYILTRHTKPRPDLIRCVPVPNPNWQCLIRASLGSSSVKPGWFSWKSRSTHMALVGPSALVESWAILYFCTHIQFPVPSSQFPPISCICMQYPARIFLKPSTLHRDQSRMHRKQDKKGRIKSNAQIPNGMDLPAAQLLDRVNVPDPAS